MKIEGHSIADWLFHIFMMLCLVAMLALCAYGLAGVFVPIGHYLVTGQTLAETLRATPTPTPVPAQQVETHWVDQSDCSWLCFASVK